MAQFLGSCVNIAILFVMYDQVHSAVDITSRKAAITREASKLLKLLIGSTLIAKRKKNTGRIEISFLS